MASTPSALRVRVSAPTASYHNDTFDNHKTSLFTIAPPPNPTLKTPSVRSRLSKLCQEGQPLLAQQLFDAIPRPKTVVWNALIIGFICNNMPHEALLLYSQMRNAYPDIQGDSYTYSSVLKACAETLNFKLGRAIHCHFVRCLSHPSRIVYNSLLNMYSTCLSQPGYLKGFDDFSKYDLIRKVFSAMPKRDVIAWNTMVSWYVKTERYEQAVRQFRMMMKMGIKPSPVSFVNVFPAIASIGDHMNANVLYGMLLKLGTEYVNDFYVISSAISMYAELGYLDFARRVFDSCFHKNSEVWNSMIGGYVQNNYSLEGIKLFLQLLEMEQTLVDDVTFLLALTAVSQIQCLKLAQQMHALFAKNLSLFPVRLVNAVIAMYSRCNSVCTSFEVFEKMPERDVVSWNTMISAFVQNGLDDEGLMLVYEMQKQFRIDSVTVAALLSAASNLRNLEIGKQTHGYLLRHGIQFEGMDSYLIDMYAKSGLIRTSQKIFENSMNNRDQATWNAMIAGYTQHGLFEEAFITFRQMLGENAMPNAVTLSSILPACNQLGSINMGKQLHGFSIRSLLDKNIFVSTALIDMYSKLGAISHAEAVFTMSTEKNSVTYTSMILAYGQHGMGNRALVLFNSMQKAGVKPDSITLVAVLSACSYAGLVDEGLKIFESMRREFNVWPLTRHYGCVADMLGRAGRVVEAYEFVKQLGDEATFEIWGTVLAACRLHGHVELGKVVAEKLVDMDIKGSLAGYQVLLSNMYAEEGNWDDVDKVRKEMREKGVRKDVGRSWIDIGGHVTYFVSKDQDHSECEKMYELLDLLTMEMKDINQKL